MQTIRQDMEATNLTVSEIANVSNQTMIPIKSKEIFDAYNIFLYTIIALGVPGNLLVLIVFMKHRPSKTTDWFIVFITTFDFLSSLFNVPVYVTLTNTMWQLYGTDAICKLHMYLSQSIVLSSSFLICGLALDRYIKVCRPNATFKTKARARNGCIAITVATSLLSIPCLFINANIKGRCNDVAMNSYLFSYYLMVFVVFCTATLIVVVAYIQVSKAIRNSELKMRRHQSEHVNRIHDGTKRQSWYREFCLWVFLSIPRGHRVAPSVTDFSESNYITPSRLAKQNMKNSEARQTLTIKVRSESAAGTSVGNHEGSGPILTSRATISTVSFAPITHSGEATNSSTKKGHSRPQGIKNASIRTTRIAFLVCAVFVIYWLPPWICFFLATQPSFLAKPTVMRFMLFGKMTYLLNTVVNPFVYAWFNRKFRQQLNGLFRCIKI